MTNWNRIKEISRINQREFELNISESGSWHNRYSNSAYIFVGNLHFDLNEGDLITVFSQFGEIVDCNLIRDKDTGDPKGFAFIAFENQKSTNLAIDNMNGSLLLNRTLNIDHVQRYRKPKHFKNKKMDKMDNNKYGDIDEDDESYEQRREKIWNYNQYLIGNNDSNKKMDKNSMLQINKEYFKEKKEKENIFKIKQNKLDKQIEIRKLKKKLLRMKNNDNKNNKNNDINNKDFKCKDNDKWIENGNELRDKTGKLIDIEYELEKRKKLKEMEIKEKYKNEMKQIKLEKKRKKLEKKSKSQILNSKLKKINKKRKKTKHKKYRESSIEQQQYGNNRPFKRRKLNY